MASVALDRSTAARRELAPAGAPRIAMLLDHPIRDLAGLVLTAAELCRRGAVCHLVPANLGWREIWALQPDLVVFNYFRRSNEPLGRGLAEVGMPFVLLDTEGGVWPDFEEYRQLLWADAGLLRRASAVCAWGPRFAEWLVDAGVFAPEQVCVTGCPRFDFYAPQWRSVLAGGAHRARARILINTNFSTVNPRFTTVENKIATSRRNFGWSDAKIRAILDTETQAIDATITLARDLADAFPAAEVLLRPHPFEDPARYRSALADRPNVRVDNDGPVQPEILASSVVIQRSCTTGIEAGLGGTPTLSPQWVPAPFLMPTAEAVSVPCASLAELRAAVAAILDGRFALPDRVRAALDQVIADWFHRIDGLAHRRVADAVWEAVPRSAGWPGEGRAAACTRFLYRHGTDGAPLRGLELAAGVLRQGVGLPAEWSYRRLRPVPSAWWTQTAKAFDAAQVAGLLAGLRGAGGRFAGVQAAPARERGDYAHGHHGFAVTLYGPGAGQEAG